MAIFHSYVSLPEGMWVEWLREGNLLWFYDPPWNFLQRKKGNLGCPPQKMRLETCFFPHGEPGLHVFW